MKPEIKKKWVEALLSGKYKQGKRELYYKGKYCCLGVLRDVGGGQTPMDDGVLDRADLIRFGLSDQIQWNLAHLNDNGVPFDMIAGLIDVAL